MTRRLVGLLAVGIGAVALVNVIASPLGAGGNITLTIEKVVEGDVAPGTVFVVDLNCGDAPDVGGTQVTFDGEGNADPPGSNVIQWTSIPVGAFDCTPTEQSVTGITTTYACTATGAVDCGAPGPQASPIELGMNGTGTATVTVTNAPVPPTPPPPPPRPEPPAPVVAAPRFTG